jgi:uncharacterized protein (TIGR01244 family)
MPRLRNPLRSFVLLVLLAACRTVVVEGAPGAPPLDAPGFVSLGPADAPSRLRKCGNTDAPLECTGPLVAVAAQPSEAQFAAAQAAGYRTIVNFRTPGEEGYVDEQAAVERLGLRYVSIPVKGHEVEASQADRLDAVLSDASAGPVLLHCRSGKRATMVWTVWLARREGLPAEDALRYGARAGLSGEAKDAVEKVLR